MKHYLAVKPNAHKTTHLKVELTYNLGGFNVFTCKQEARGYYLSVCPVKRERDEYGVMESFVAFSGTKLLVKEVKRKSQKAEQEAYKLAAGYTDELVNYILAKHGLELEED